MKKLGPREGPCGWDNHPAEPELERLHQILNCASSRGCGECVRCSERALELVLKMARRRGPGGVAMPSCLEPDSEDIRSFGL